MSEGEVRDEPAGRRPDLWLPPTSSAPGSTPTWRQPPSWQPPPVWQQPAGRPRTRPATRAAGVRPPRTNRLLVLGLIGAALFLPLCLALVAALAIGTGPGGGRPTSTSTPAPPPGTVPAVWSLEPGRLRPDLPGARFMGSLDGSFEQGYLGELGGSWLTITGNDGGADTVLHALDPDTGAVRWERQLDGVLCAREAPARTALCASVLQRDPATGLGTRWQLHVLDPSTGADRATRAVDGWFTAVHWTGRSFVALEQREPAPYAVLRGFTGTDLRDLWTRDLAHERGQEEMFTEDRVILRPEPKRPGLALDRPRLRDVGAGLVAVWAGQRTAFVDARSGRLVMMPHCSRLVDDGELLWCNEVDGVTAYTYAGARAVQVHGPRLAFPGDDGIGVDRDRPVFLDEDGAAVAVNRKTGDVGVAFTPPGRGSAFGVSTMPSTETVGDRTFLVGGAGTMLLDPGQDEVLWRNPAITLTDVPVVDGDRALLGEGRLTWVDLATGASGAELRTDALYVVALGSRVAGVGYQGISLLQL